MAARTLSGRTTIEIRNTTGHAIVVPAVHVPGGVSITEPAGGSSRLRERSVAAGESVSLELDWTTHGRADLALADWYPRIPELGTVVLVLDVPAEEVVTASGVVLCGDPGWASARRPPGRQVVLDRDYLGSAADHLERLGLTGSCDTARLPPGRKVLVWYGDRIPVMGLAMSPRLQYEEGDIFNHPVRVFYWPGEERTWGAGFVSRRAETAIAWLHEIFGGYPWPPTSTLHAPVPAAGGRTVPILMWSDTTSQDQILRGFGHQYTGLILSPVDSSWWLDEALNRFQVTWFHEAMGRVGDYPRLERRVLDWELDGRVVPVVGFETDSIAAARGELFFHELHDLLRDDVFRNVLQAYYAQDTFRSVNEAEFRRIVEDSSKRDLSIFFRQWLHEPVLYDYQVREATRGQLPDGRWQTTAEVEARTPGIFPVQVWVIAGRDTLVKRIPGHERRERVVDTTVAKPERVIVDPLGRGHDWNMLNNQKTFGYHPLDILVGRDRPRHTYLDSYFTRQSRRDRLTVGIAPTVWFNDPGGWTVGLRRRDDYLGRFLLNQFYVTQSLGAAGTDHLKELNGSFEIRDPPSWRAPGWDERVAAAWVEGRGAASVGIERVRRPGLTDQAERAVGVSVDWLSVASPTWVDRRYYDDAGTVELTVRARLADTLGAWRPRILATIAGGYQYANDVGQPFRDETYGRATLTAATRRAAGRAHIGARVFAGWSVGTGSVVRQRLIYISGADPYEQWRSPFLRTRGALFVRDGMNYTDPGGAGARGFDPHLAARQAYGLTLEVEMDLVPAGSGLFNRIALAGFADAVAADGDLDPEGRNRMFGVGDAGPGLRIDHRLGKTSFQTRLDVPLWVSRPELAQDQGPGGATTGWRWTFSFAPSF